MQFPKKKRAKKSARARLIDDCSRLWSQVVRSENGWRCAHCGKYFEEGARGGLDAHHLIERGLRGCNLWWFFPWVGIPLCKGYHHYHVHARRDPGFLQSWEMIQRRHLAGSGRSLGELETTCRAKGGARLREFDLEIVKKRLQERLDNPPDRGFGKRIPDF